MPDQQVLTGVAALLGLLLIAAVVLLLLTRRSVAADAVKLARLALQEERDRSEAAAAAVRADADRYHRDAKEQVDAQLRDAERRRADVEQWAATDKAELRTDREGVVRRDALVSEREARAAKNEAVLESRLAMVEAERAEVAAQASQHAVLADQCRAELERVAGLSVEQAVVEIVARAEHDARLQAAASAREIERAAKVAADRTARGIIVGAIQRVASEQTTESVVSTVDLPGDDLKGRIIGREGRNIRSFEQITGVNVLIDDTPESVLLSCFDPVRREIARVALTDLVADGRIHPARIEEAYERSKATIEERITRAAEDALAEVGITDLHADLVPIVGQLKYRTSYGQNVLRHLVESAHLAGIMAAELGLDVATCKRAAFLHDIGKALTHEHEGSHAIVGADLARRYGEHPDIVHAIEAHHNEVEPRTVEAILTQAADAISGSRPGARRESLEAYVKRLERLEEIAGAYPGVERVFAMQAGREIRVMVAPGQLDDLASAALARDIARQVEEELTYPGQIKITVIRESRAVELAR